MRRRTGYSGWVPKSKNRFSPKQKTNSRERTRISGNAGWIFPETETRVSENARRFAETTIEFEK
jgi:hypothetical protein